MPKQGLPFNHPGFKFTETVQESKSISRFTSGVIILAASGMCDAGRIRHHLKNHLWRPKSTILLVGYQAEGTLGRLLEQGNKKSINIQGEAVKVRARIRKIDIYSGHADGNQLVEWIKARQPIKQGVFLCHGSEQSLQAMRAELLELGFDKDRVIIPELDDEFELVASGEVTKHPGISRRLEPEVITKPDWHNDLAQLTLDIRSSLEDLSNDQQKTQLLKKLRNELEDK
ncbi:MBL fold metallo-hydrolase RNA specificity domain-containing protein [Kiloniella sp.]|uniref:MBL fold metallo-hydrolase RNA specificity domain-containing protein n=1 Tax=Kiloniella sp. TaxID=1938587 RepID=UPI003B01AE3B